MKRFTGAWGTRFGILFMGFCGFGTFYFFVILAIQRALEPHGLGVSMLIAAVPFGILGLAMGCFCLYGLVDSFTVYTADEEKIEKRALYGTQQMAWQDVTAFKTKGTATSDINLTDASGKRMRIDPGLVRGPQGELRALINERLAGLRAKQMQELGWEEKSFYPVRGVIWLVLPFFFMLFGFGLMPLLDPRSVSGGSGERWAMMAILETMALLLGLLGVHGYTWKVTISRGMILSQSLFRRKAIPMDQIDSVLTRDVSTKNGKTNQTIIKGAGQKIVLTDNMADYMLIRDFIQQQANRQAAERGEIEGQELEKKETRQGNVVMVVCLTLLAGMMAFLIWSARTRLATQDDLDRHGVTTTGQIDGKYISSSKSTRYLVQYHFDLNGGTYFRSSPMTRSDYEAATIGQPISIVYLPDHPGTSRAARSVGRREAEGLQRVAYINLAVFAMVPLLLLYSRRKARLRAAQKSMS